MYLSTIKKQMDFTTLLEKLKYVKEVYSDTEFTFEKDKAVFYLVCSEPIDSSRAYLTLSEMFDLGCHVYVVFDAYSNLLQGQRIIWKEGAWYV